MGRRKCVKALYQWCSVWQHCFYASKALPNEFNFSVFLPLQIVNFFFCHCPVLCGKLVLQLQESKACFIEHPSPNLCSAASNATLAVDARQNISTCIFPSKKKEVTLLSFCGPWKILRSQRSWRFEPLGCLGTVPLTVLLWALVWLWCLLGACRETLWSREEQQHCWKFGEKRWKPGLGPSVFVPLLLIQMFHF